MRVVHGLGGQCYVYSRSDIGNQDTKQMASLPAGVSHKLNQYMAGSLPVDSETLFFSS